MNLLDVAGDDGWLFVRDGIGVAGRGEFARIPAAAVGDVLAELGPDTVAIGARPFAPDRDWDLVIPTHQVRVHSDGIVTEIDLGDVSDPPMPHPISGDVEVSAVDDPEEWKKRVATATQRIRAGAADKVVLAREVRATTTTRFSATRLAGRLASRFDACYLYSVDGLVGASPELLIERHGSKVYSQPMAGSARRSTDPDLDARLRAELFASRTYRHEHQLTIDMVHDTLLDFTSYLDFEPEPSIVTLENVAHLATRVEGELSSPPASVLDLVQALHPTPAVSGRPREAAIAVIDELEPRDRGRYGGTVGWVDGAGNGCWAVTIRCAQLSQDRRSARVHAGCGLVADSEPATELAESEAKLQAILSVLT